MKGCHYILLILKNQNSVTQIMARPSGDLRLIKNQKLRKLFTKVPNFREPQSLNYSRFKKD